MPNHNFSDRPVLSDFFAKLWAMNWVQREHKRHQAINEKASPLVTEVFAAVKAALESFNKLYREAPRSQVEFSVLQSRITFSMLLPLPQRQQVEKSQHAEGVIEFDANGFTIVATFKLVPAKTVTLHMDADDSDRVFLCEESGAKVPDADTASRLLLENFLMPLSTI